jgi:hypothetical protein
VGYTIDVRIILFLNALEINRAHVRMAATQVYPMLFMEMRTTAVVIVPSFDYIHMTSVHFEYVISV